MKKVSLKSISLAGCLALLTVGCGSIPSTNGKFGPTVHTLQVTSVNPTNTVQIGVSPADNNGAGSDPNQPPATGLDLVYNVGTTVTLTAPATEQFPFFAWVGCDSTTGLVCTVTMNAERSVQVQYVGVESIVITPIDPVAGVPSTTQFSVVVNGLGDSCYLLANANKTPIPLIPCAGSPTSISLSSSGFTGSLGTLSPPTVSGSTTTYLYTTPFPAPPSLTVMAISSVNPSITAQTTLTLDPTIPATGPALSVDLGTVTHEISPNIYGMNDYKIPAGLPALVNLPIERWGGDMTTRYNYSNDAYNSAGDFYFENNVLSTTGHPVTSAFDTQVTLDRTTNTKTLATVPLIGYTTDESSACSFSVAKYGAQKQVDPKNTDCGNGVLSSTGNNITGNNPLDTSYVINQTFDSGWVNFLTSQYGTAAKGGVAMYALDNEPEYWSGVHFDVHPAFMSYDELTNKGLAYAQAIKTADPTALVTGPVISSWTEYFISTLDQFDGYDISPYCEYDNELDYKAHGSIPLIPYYLQQFAKNQATTGTRLLDYLDMHTYFAPNGIAFATEGSVQQQQQRLDSTRVFWDPTYLDPNGNYTNPFPTATSDPCKSPVQLSPMLIPRAQGWVTANYPGTKVAFTEYNWGGLESMNGALAQADILGIFGSYGLDMAMLWAPPDPVKQYPGVAAFQMYTNYDGKSSQFGDKSLASVSGEQSYLAVYGAQRTSDHAITVMVINKGGADQTATLSLLNTTASGNATSYQFTPANLQAIVAGPSIAITGPAAGSTTSTLSATFPAQSITLVIVPQP